ncbi:MAG: DUF2341 domain-containing protein, partial [Akkermansiaceae bacterium]|nr:DUF2341 domain-containing protein [Akkermansiaceae bacterium]
MKHSNFFLLAVVVIAQPVIPNVARGQANPANPYPSWQKSGSIYMVTTPDGADLPAAAVLDGFPLLVRLTKDWFDFSQAKPNGADVRFSDASGLPLSYQIEEWNSNERTAAIWVRIPRIEGNCTQPFHLHWGKADAPSESNGQAVFNAANGFLSVFHMSEPIEDELGTLAVKDLNTSSSQGMIGLARHLNAGQGISGGKNVTSFPTEASPFSSEAWFKADRVNSVIVGWGNEKGESPKAVAQIRSPSHIRFGADGASKLALSKWTHVLGTYSDGELKVYLNGRLDGSKKQKLQIKSPANFSIGGWNNEYRFIGDIDEVRVSTVARSPDWIKLQYENQKPQQTLVGPIVQPGNDFE